MFMASVVRAMAVVQTGFSCKLVSGKQGESPGRKAFGPDPAATLKGWLGRRGHHDHVIQCFAAFIR